MISQGTLFGTRASQASPWWAVRFWPADLEKGYRWMDLHQSVKVGFIQSDLESLGIFKIFLCLIYLFIYFFAFVFVCLSVPHNVCTHSPHTYIYMCMQTCLCYVVLDTTVLRLVTVSSTHWCIIWQTASRASSSRHQVAKSSSIPIYQDSE